MAWNLEVVCVYFYLFVAVQGKLVLVRSPVCPGDSAVYRCNVTGDGLTWSWNSGSSTSPRYTVIPGFTQPGVRNQTILTTPVQFNLTEVGPPYTNVIATIFNPQQLNGIVMECDMQELTIDILQVMSPVPSALIVALAPNGSDYIEINPVEDKINSIEYELSGDKRVMATTPISINASEDINITFFHCKNSTEFFLNAECLLAEGDMGHNYTFFQNETWEVSRKCGTILVTCTSDGDWSEDISCLELTTTIDPPAKTDLEFTMSATSSSSPGSGTIPYIWIGVAVGSVLAVIIFALVVLVIVLLCQRRNRKKLTLEEMELNHLEEDANEYSTLTHPTPARSAMSADAYDTINSGFTTRQPPEAPSYGILNGSAATGRDRPRNGVQDRDQDGGLDRFQDRAQDTDSDTASHQYAKTKHIPQKSSDMMYSEVAMGDQATLHPHLTTESGVQYSGVQHGVRPEDVNLNLDTLLIQLRPVTDQYQELGVAAGLSQETIEEVTSHAAVAFDGLVEVCDAWIRSLRRQNTAPTWRAVSDMLQEIGQEKLARDLLKVYSTGSLPVVVDMHTVEIPKQATQSPPPPIPQRNDVDIEEDGDVAMATVVSIRRDRVPTESEMSPPPPIPPFHPNEDQAMAVPPRPPKKGAPQPGAPAIPPKILPPKPSPTPAPEALPSLPPKPNKKA